LPRLPINIAPLALKSMEVAFSRASPSEAAREEVATENAVAAYELMRIGIRT